MMIMMTTIELVMPSGQPQYVSTKECVLKVISQFKYENRKKKMKIEIKQENQLRRQSFTFFIGRRSRSWRLTPPPVERLFAYISHVFLVAVQGSNSSKTSRSTAYATY